MLEVSRQFELQVLVNGNPVTEYFHDNNVFIEGRDGTEFSVRVKNNSHEDVEAIVSVDGLSILNGKAAGPKSPGFIIPAYRSNDFAGWTISNTQAKSFFFTGRSNSYAGRSNKASNIGVIGLMVFRKKPSQIVYANNPNLFGGGFPSPTGGGWSGGGTAGGGGHGGGGGGIFRGYQGPWETFGVIAQNSADGGSASLEVKASATAAVNNLGAGWGKEVQQNLKEVAFERRDANNPDALLAMYYDDRKGLERRGIVLDRSKSYSDPFPDYTSSGTFCKPPTA